jgi:hypothetical protein
VSAGKLRPIPAASARCCASFGFALLMFLGMALPAYAREIVTSVVLTSPTSQTAAPFTIGLALRKGDVPGTPALDLPNQQVLVTRRWNDGSVKHAIASGRVALSANVPMTVRVLDAPAAPPGTALTPANIVAANPQASVVLGSYGSVTLASLLAAPVRVWVAGPEMIEAHYRSAVGTTGLVVWFHVRLYASGRLWVRAIVDNGYLDVPPTQRNYTPSVSIGGAVVFDNGGATLSHFGHTRWSAESWIAGDPQVTPRHDTDYLRATKLVPNYLPDAPTAARLDSLARTYAPYQRGDWTAYMPTTGFQNSIGLLPLWDALYVTSGADPRAYAAVLANAKAIYSFPIDWRDSATGETVRPSDRPDWSVLGRNGGGSNDWSAGPMTWDTAHHGSAGYLAYLLTGDHYYLEAMQSQAATVYLMVSTRDFYSPDAPVPNLGTSRRLIGQTRGYAWSLRTVTQLAAIGPANDTIVDDYRALLAGNITHLTSLRSAIVPDGIGYVFEASQNTYGTGKVAPWQQHFFIQAIGMGSDLEPLASMSAYDALRDYLYRGAVGILGDASGYCFNQAGVYTLTSNDGTSVHPNAWFKNWSLVYNATIVPPAACTNTLANGDGGITGAATGYWGNLLPAIAYAVDHGAPGAAAAWARLTGATNWAQLRASGFGNTPIFGITPRPRADPIFADGFDASVVVAMNNGELP